MNRGRAAARRVVLRRLLSGGEASTQDDIARLLARRGHVVTQATVSRDLAAIGAVKTTGDDGEERYALAPAAGREAVAPQELARLLQAFAIEIGHSGNLAVVKTAPGSAGPVAAALDSAEIESVLATIAGDDTVLVVARSAQGGAGLARALDRLLEVGK